MRCRYLFKMTPQNRCYLCQSKEFSLRPGSVRDNQDLKVYECDGCGLVYLSSFEHVRADLYEESGMHGAQPLDIKKWLSTTEQDDERRFQYLKPFLAGKTVLDFGCGAGGFLIKAKQLASKVYGVELERRLQEHFRVHNLSVFENIDTVLHEHGKLKCDVITLFHVLEHLPDPKGMLMDLASLLKMGGEIIIEVPHADDALLSLYECEPFSHFTYWSCHLFLFTVKTLELLAEQAGLKVNYIKQVQRYPLSNHLYWLAKGKPGGHQVWHFLNSPEIHGAYEKQLASVGKCDTLTMSLSR